MSHLLYSYRKDLSVYDGPFTTLANEAVFTPLTNFVRLPSLLFRCEGCGEKGVNNTIQVTILNNWEEGVVTHLKKRSKKKVQFWVGRWHIEF